MMRKSNQYYFNFMDEFFLRDYKNRIFKERDKI